MSKKRRMIAIGLVSMFILTAISCMSVNAENINANYYEEPILQIDNVQNNPTARTQITRDATIKRGSEKTFYFTIKNVGGGQLYIPNINDDWESRGRDGFVSYWFDGDFPLEHGESLIMSVKYDLTNELRQHKSQFFSIAITNTDDDVHYPTSGKYNQYIIQFTITADGVIDSEIKNDKPDIRDIFQNSFSFLFNLFSPIEFFKIYTIFYQLQ